ncbi:serine/threonine protein kinase [Planoprotostelium fungivorum]|uniref:Serine/threonine protein kinase n=1 Tax=Planoprotostelium fungivorum TaxID=1890364 RepID=A0A2P6NVE5_9EUKA|nr:serine/threonine protein kinase [Planoprotostelium fungivorum]
MSATLDSELLTAAREGDIQKLQKVYNRGGRIDSLGPLNRSALHIAALEGRLDVVMFLLENGANKNAQAASGETPLHLATLNGHKNIIEILLDEGADPKITNFNGKTPADYARKRDLKKVYEDFASGNVAEDDGQNGPNVWQQRKNNVDSRLVEEFTSVGYKRADVLDVIFSLRTSDQDPNRSQIMKELEKRKEEVKEEIAVEPMRVDECKVCLERPMDTVLIPCGHICVCHQCSSNMGQCPMCRSVIQTVVKTYKS